MWLCLWGRGVRGQTHTDTLALSAGAQGRWGLRHSWERGRRAELRSGLTYDPRPDTRGGHIMPEGQSLGMAVSKGQEEASRRRPGGKGTHTAQGTPASGRTGRSNTTEGSGQGWKNRRARSLQMTYSAAKEVSN